ncbi:hypothetical protein RvY_06468-2 [Ramazzottius varieornatus]|uniref:C2H2-type domain-containing protein n=1 Tax=Ramazzottius varieornatus TaxID=947166 RepID=A0A1D1V248_RAMVA|nr:hypothetical protein RvY_06468-2 [Ramazzottius varieornatus]
MDEEVGLPPLLMDMVQDKTLVTAAADATAEITADDQHQDEQDEKAVTMSPDTSTIASRSSVSNDACCTPDNTEHLSQQQVATTPPSSERALFSAMQSCPSGQKSKEHLHLESSRNIPVSREGSDVTESKDSGKATRRYQCDACGRLLSTSTSLERHMLTHTGQRPFPCPLCPICFTTNGNLLRHMKSCHEINHDVPSQAPQTSQTSGQLGLLEMSPATQALLSGALPFSQPILNISPDTSFNSPASEDRDDEKDREGSDAGMQDSSKYKPFLCTLCDKVFSTRTNCERHIRNRHSERTYSRTELVKMIKFIPKNSKESHAICKYCKKDFLSNKMLKHHLRSPYSSCRRKPFACQLCEATFSTRNNCIRHISNLHPERKADYKTLIVLNAPVPMGDNEYGMDMADDDGSPPTMAILSPGVMSSFSSHNAMDTSTDMGYAEDSRAESPEEASFSETFSPENHAMSFSPEGFVDDALDLTMGPLDLSLKKRNSPDDVRSSPTSWFARQDQCLKRGKNAVGLNFGGASRGKKSPMVSVSSLMQERAVPFRAMATNGGNGPMNEKAEGTEKNSRASKRPRPYICQYCGIGFTIRGNMYRHFRHKHPEHVSKRRQKRNLLSEDAAKQIDDVLDSVVSVDPPTNQPLHSLQSILRLKEEEPTSDVDEHLDVGRDDRMEEEGEDEGDFHVDVDDSDEMMNEEHRADGEGEGEESSEVNSEKAKEKANSYSMSPHVHACHECGRKFPWQSSLERHMYTHTGQKPYSCKWCPLKFSIKSNCERHCIRIHGKSFSGSDSGFTSNPDDKVPPPLTKKRSRSKAVQPFPYPCRECSLAFETMRDMELHMENNHIKRHYDDDRESVSSYGGSLCVDA